MKHPESGIQAVFSSWEEQSWPFIMDRIQREADHFIGQPACLEAKWIYHQPWGFKVTFSIETMAEGMREFRIG